MSDLDRLMLSFVTQKQRFNYRVACVAVRDGHILVCREDDDDYVMLPGGRVEFGETSDLALQREISEELKCDGQIGMHVFTAENFYRRDDEAFHEIGIYYVVELAKTFPFVTNGVCFETQDEGHDLHFSWIPTDFDTLTQHKLHPKWLYTHLSQPLTQHVHIKADEGHFITG